VVAVVQSHRWDVTPAEAIAIQEKLRPQVVTNDALGPVNRVAGIDVGFRQVEGTNLARVAVVLLSFPGLQLLAKVVHEEPVRFPYVPGLLAFREGPAILGALARLEGEADVLILDGQGLAHPRRFGIACHVGVVTDRPAIGCAKSILVGKHGLLPPSAGSWLPLTDRGETIGAAVRTQSDMAPVYVSTGHRVSLETAVQLVLACVRSHRLPEPTRLAHQVASESSHRKTQKGPENLTLPLLT